MGTFELELPAGMEDDIEVYLDETDHYTSKSELIRDAVRRFLRPNVRRATMGVSISTSNRSIELTPTHSKT